MIKGKIGFALLVFTGSLKEKVLSIGEIVLILCVS